MAGAKEGGAFLEEFLAAGFASAQIVRRHRNARTAHPSVMVAEVVAIR